MNTGISTNPIRMTRTSTRLSARMRYALLYCTNTYTLVHNNPRVQVRGQFHEDKSNNYEIIRIIQI